MTTFSEVCAGPPAESSPGDSDDGDPDQVNWLAEALRAVADAAGPGVLRKIGVSKRTLHNWSRMGPDWSPPPSSMAAIRNSPVFDLLAPEVRQRIFSEAATRTFHRAVRALDVSDDVRELTVDFWNALTNQGPLPAMAQKTSRNLPA